MLSKSLVSFLPLLFLLFTDSFLFFLKFVKLVSDALFAHLNAHNLHYLGEVVDVFHGCFLIDLCGTQFLPDILFGRQNQFNVVLGHKS